MGAEGWERSAARRSSTAVPLVLGAALGAAVLAAVLATVGGGGEPRGVLEVEAAPPGEQAPPRLPAPPGEPPPTIARAVTDAAGGSWDLLPAAPLGQREGHSVTWTGQELVVWGGLGSTAEGDVRALADGAAYDPVTARWRQLPPGPSARFGHAAVWTGAELIVWGGAPAPGQFGPLSDGAAYDPATDSWRRLPPATIPGRSRPAAVWTGQELLVWGSQGTGDVAAGAYDPEADAWRRLPPGPLSPRLGHSVVWTGRELVVWGGAFTPERVAPVNDGAAYDPAADRWRLLAPSGLAGRFGHAAAWTGQEMVVWGGVVTAAGIPGTLPAADGAAYDPARDTWRLLPEADLVGRSGHTAVWTGSAVLFWGGVLPGGGAVTALLDGAAYEPAADRWRPIGAAPLATRGRYGAAWTGRALVVWGGRWDPAGALYRPGQR